MYAVTLNYFDSTILLQNKLAHIKILKRNNKFMINTIITTSNVCPILILKVALNSPHLISKPSF